MSVTNSDMMVHLYEGKLNGILKAAVKPDGSDKLLKISRLRITYAFQLTGSKKIPALAVKRINEHCNIIVWKYKYMWGEGAYELLVCVCRCK